MKKRRKAAGVKQLRDPICTKCYQLIDIQLILPKIMAGEQVVHECGKVLFAGSTER